jgi:hypothetical protein
VLAVDITDGGITPVTVEGLRGRDTEGLAVGACADGTQRSCLFIGDIGNNLVRPQRVRVWRVPEPPLDGTGEPITVDGDAATLRYPDGPVDAEALLVDDGRPLLVTKPRPDPTTGVAPPPRLLGADAFADGVLRDLGAIDLPDPPLGLASAVVGNVVTGGDADGDRVVLRTYDHVVVYAPPEPGAPVTTLPTWTPTVVDTPRLPQPEAVALDHCGLWLISEGVESIWLVPGVAGSDDHDVREQACPTGTARS